MKIILNHKPEIYLKAEVRVWFALFAGRMIKKRVRLTLLTLIVSFLLFLYNTKYFLYFLFFVFLIIFIDFFDNLIMIVKNSKKVKDYNAKGGESIYIKADTYFCYVQDGVEFRKSNWGELNEVIRLEKVLSFKNRESKDRYYILKEEIGERDFQKLRLIIENQIKVIPLV